MAESEAPSQAAYITMEKEQTVHPDAAPAIPEKQTIVADPPSAAPSQPVPQPVPAAAVAPQSVPEMQQGSLMSQPDATDTPSLYDEFVDTCPPPPSYMEAAVAAPPVDVKTIVIRNDPPLTYMDFLPPNQTQKFPDLVENANFWLAANRQFKVKSCEAMTVMMKEDGMPDTLTSFYHASPKGTKRFVKALRLWVMRRYDQSEPTEVLRTLVRSPSAQSAGVGFGGDVFARFSKILSSLNAELRERPLPGRVVNIQTVQIKTADHSAATDNDPDQTYWEEGDKSKTYTNTLRLFYIEGPPAYESVGWKDIAPVHVKASPSEAPRFEPTTKTIYKVGHWAHHQRDIRITNIQTLEAKLAVGQMASAKPTVDTDRVDFHDTKFGDFQFVQYLRVYYTKSRIYIPGSPYCLNYRPFLPFETYSRMYEPPAANMKRLGDWIDYNSQVFGSMGVAFENSLVCMESLKYEVRPELGKGVDHEQTTYKYRPTSGHYYVYGVRLFVNGPFFEPPAALLNIPAKMKEPESSTCNLI